MPSYSPVFSQGFIYYDEATPNRSFEVPAGFTAVVRDFSAVVGAGDSLWNLGIAEGPGAPFIYVAYLNVVGAPASGHQEGRWVVNAGGTIAIYQFTLGVDGSCYVGGYLLRNNLT